MKVKILKNLVLLFALISVFGVNAQSDFQGVAYYESKTSAEMPDFGGRQMSEEQKKRIAERMKSMLEKSFVLTFNRTESIYTEEEKLEAPTASGGRGFRMMGNFTSGPQYKNIKDNQLLQEQELFGKQFLIHDSLPKLAWKMGTETKQIGQYTCFKATAVKQVSEMEFRRMGPPGRRNDDDENKPEIPREIEVTAWYTPQIPVNQGPGEYWGLPGLILEVNADKTTILCSKIVLNAQEKSEIKVPKKGKEVSKAEYDEIVKKKMEEMSEMFRNRRGGR
ncbi:GLPGLI family protein [Formosa sp. S-31]|uniref:GLPGLI family protein n=1 Tax=Formosa sp. S-31 TaxID=2790949 RepID=UPI003EB7EAC7